MLLKKNIIKNFFLYLLLMISLTACVSFKGSKQDTSKIDGGIFKSINKALSWEQKVLIPTISGKPANFSNVNAFSLAMDPGDHNAIYFGSISSGLLYSLDAGAEWREVEKFQNKTIRSIAVDPKSKCRVFVAYDNKVLRTDDCLRTWKEIYYDNDPKVAVEAIAIDHYESKNIYIAISRGDIVKSSDFGESWRTVHRVEDRVRSIVLNPQDSRIVYVASHEEGIFKSIDSGESWEELESVKDFLKQEKLKVDIRELVFAKNKDSESQIIFVATYYGLIKSMDDGATWERINLIPPENKAAINSLAVNPSNNQEIYYVTNTTFYRSQDGGQNWTPSKIQSTRAGWKILIDPVESKNIYMGLRRLEK